MQYLPKSRTFPSAIELFLANLGIIGNATLFLTSFLAKNALLSAHLCIVPCEYCKKVTEMKEEQPWFLLLSLISHLEMTPSSCANVHNTCSTDSHVPWHHRGIKVIEIKAKVVFANFFVPCAWKEGGHGRMIQNLQNCHTTQHTNDH
jgi:hypothetical protein